MTNERNERKERMIRLNEFKSNDGKKTETREKNRQNRADIRDDEVARIFSNVMCESWSYKKKIVVCVCVCGRIIVAFSSNEPNLQQK